MKRKFWKNLLWGLLVIFFGMQAFQIEKTNPPVDPQKDFVSAVNPPAPVADLLKKACFDCHSHETKYPWYSYVAPASFFLRSHIVEGREHLNFSEWATYNAEDKAHAAEEIGEVLQEGEMPLTSYLILHPEAKITDQQRQQLMDFFGQNAETEGIGGHESKDDDD